MKLPEAKNIWRVLAQLGVYLVSICSTFVLSPPDEVGADSATRFPIFSAVILSIVIGALALPLSRKRHLKHSNWWAITAVVLGIFGVVSFFEYQNLRASMSAEYARHRVVIGSEFTPEGEAYRRNESGFTKEKAVMDAAGQPAKIWTDHSIHHNALWLYGTYCTTVVLLALAIISAIQAQYCAQKKTRGNRNESHISTVGGAG